MWPHDMRVVHFLVFLTCLQCNSGLGLCEASNVTQFGTVRPLRVLEV